MFELMDSYSQSAIIKVLGVGGGGGNAVSHMVQAGLEGVDFICINTDAQALKHSKVRTALQILVDANDRIGLQPLAEQARQTYALNFPNSKPPPNEAHKKSWWHFW